MPDHKTCPYCGEEILASAVKCKHCYSVLSTVNPLGPTQRQSPATVDPFGMYPPPSGANAMPTPGPPPFAAPLSVSPAPTPMPEPLAATRQSRPGYSKLSLFRRLVAYLLDAVFALGPAVAVIMLTPLREAYLVYLEASVTMGGVVFPEDELLLSWAWALMGALAWGALYVVFRDSRGRSWGKGLVGAAVIHRASGRRCGGLRSFVRNGGALILAGLLLVSAIRAETRLIEFGVEPVWVWYAFVGILLLDPLLALLHPGGRKLGDLLAGTQVVYRRELGETNHRL